MVGNRYGDSRVRESFLHHDMAAAATHFNEAVSHKDRADLFA